MPSFVGERHGAKSSMAKNSVERLVASAIRNREDPPFLETVNMANPSNIIYSTTVWYADIKVWLLYCCNYSNTSHDSVFSTTVRATVFNNVLLKLRTAFFLTTGVYLAFSFEPLGGFDPPMAQTNALAGAIKGGFCSVITKMSTESSKIHPGSILVNSAVHHIYGKIQKNALTAPQSGGSS